MTQDATRQPDQDPALWDRHVAAYEAVFEPLTDAFAARALDALGPLKGARLLDVCAGAGGAALLAAARGVAVDAVDGSPRMTARIRERAGARRISARVADAAALDLPPNRYDAALSCFGIVLLPDPVPALRAIRRALVPGGRLAIVTWTEPGAYELASRIGAAMAAVRPPAAAPSEPAPSGPLPAQLRYAEPAALAALMAAGDFPGANITRLEAKLEAASARELSRGLAFAPGLNALMAGLGADRAAVEAEFARALEADQGIGPVSLGAVAHVAIARRTA